MINDINITGRGLRLPRGVAFTKTALVIDPGLSPEEWAEVGTYLSAAHRACGLWTGDWARYGRANFDEQFVAVQIGQLELPLHGVERFELQAQVAPEDRPEEFKEITPEHLFVVSKRLESEAERREWLQRAAAESLTPRELQASIRAGEVVKIDTERRKLRFPSAGAVRRAFDDWQQALGNSWEKTWTVADCEAVADDLRPVGEFLERILKHRDALRFEGLMERESRKGGNPLSGNTAGRKGAA